MTGYFDIPTVAVRLFINLSLFGMPTAVGLALAFRLTHVASPRFRYSLAVVCFLAVTLLPVLTTFQKTHDSSGIWNDAFNTSLIKDGDTPLTLGQPSAPISDSLLRASLTVADRMSIFIERIGESRLGALLVIVWIGIALLLVGREVAGHVLLRRSRRNWTPAAAGLRNELAWPREVSLFTHSCDWPCTTGLLKPLVVLPAALTSTLSIADARRIAKHELSHARWRDPLVNSVVRILRAMFWPSLPLWFLERVIRAEREVAADKAAIEGAESSFEIQRSVEEYAMALLSVARGCARRKVSRLYDSAATHVSAVGLEARIQRLFRFSEPLARTRLVFATVVVLSGVAGVTMLPVTSQGLSAEERAHGRTVHIARRLGPNFANSAALQRSTAAMNVLMSALKKRDWRLDNEVKSALSDIERSNTIEPLVVTLVEDKDWRVREKVAWVLGQLNDHRAVKPLVGALRDDASEVRHTAAWALGNIGDDAAADALLLNLKDDSFEARQGAAWSLGKLKDRRAVEPLIVLLGDNFADVRHAAAWALGELGDQRAVGPVSTLLSDNDPAVRAQAATTLAKISSR